MNDVKIGFQFLAKHARRTQHALLPIDVIMLNERMKECVLRRNAHLARIDFYVFDILLINFIAVLGNHDASAIVKTLQMRSGDGNVNAPDHDIAFLFGIDYRFVHAFHGSFKIDDLPFADAARWRLADPEDFERAIGAAFADNHADFRGANLKTNHQVVVRHRR